MQLFNKNNIGKMHVVIIWVVIFLNKNREYLIV